jgi:aldehyde dehydrogenase (NAD+)
MGNNKTTTKKSPAKKKQDRLRLNFSTKWDYGPAPEKTDHVELEDRYGLFINGKFQKPEKEKYFATHNPANEEKLAEVGQATKPDINKAVKAARKAYDNHWSKLSGKERAKYIFRIARLIKERAREFSVVETLDNGKPIRETRDIDIPLVAQHFFHYAGWADKLDYAFPGQDPSPMGVCGQIIPWNFPLLMAAWKLAPALACGNTCVLKPAETTPLSAMKLAELIQEADLPPGVVNIITGAGQTGATLVNHSDIDKIAFTGSTEVGKKIQSSIAGTDKSLTLELGGKAAHLIFDDAPLDQAIEGIVNGIFFNQGHVCCAGSRLLVQESVADTIIHKLKDRIETLRVGTPLDKNTDIGAINSKQQLDKIHEYMEIGKNEGADMYQSSCKLPEKGYWFPPTFFYNCSQSQRVVNEEIFGPVLTIQTFRTVEEGIEKANNTPYGLSGGVWTDKGSKIFKVSNAIRAGVMWANTFNKFDPAAPFGGYKESGFGREGGLQGLMPYLRLDE